MNINRLAVATSLGLGLTLLLLGALSIAANVPLVQASTGVIHAMTADCCTPAQHSVTSAITTSVVITDNAGLHNSMAVDSRGRLHASFNNAASDALFYAVYSDTAWQIQVVDTVDTPAQILRNSIAVDLNSDMPHISYEISQSQRYDGGNLEYAHLAGTEWISSTVVNGTRRHKQNSIAVDSSGNPHIAYSTDWLQWGWWFGIVKYVRWSGTNWVFETVYAEGETVLPPISLALDSQDNPQILFKKKYWGGKYGVHLQTWVSPTWVLTTLEPIVWQSSPPGGAALTIDDDDNLYWTYMWHGQKVGGTLISPTETITSGEEIGYSDIAVDDIGRVYVVYESGRTNTLQLAVRALSGEWVDVPLVSISTWGQSDVSLVVTQGVIHVIYLDSATQRLMHLSTPVRTYLPLIMKDYQPASD